MLTHLAIQNYALIDDLKVSFGPGFTTITGETGAGKSILLGGLSLVLGKRADMSSLRNKDKKCVVEAEFAIGNYQLRNYFDASGLDYDTQTIIRREIHPGGKSRAFINDTPVTLDILSELGNRLIDVHSQHQTLQLTDNDFQLKVIDALAQNGSQLSAYKAALSEFTDTSRQLDKLIELQNNAIKEQDYNSFLLNELENAQLKEGMQEELEEQFEQLNNVEQILEQLGVSHQLLYDEQVGVLALLSELKQTVGRLAPYGTKFNALCERLQSIVIETDDIAGELQSLEGSVEADPQLLEQVNSKLQLLYDLKRKHSAMDVTELLSVRESLAEKVNFTENLESEIASLRKSLENQADQVRKVAGELSSRRQAVLPKLKTRLETDLVALGMPNATFNIGLRETELFKSNGTDELQFLFSANKGTDFGELKKVASGGELSRIMLTIKSILAGYEQLPTMMFDEIDSGVSGEVSNRMGDIMQKMSKNMQIFSITHLPQVASKGDHHYKVYKVDDQQHTHTRMKALSQDERVVELAEMLGGKTLSDSALAHARELLN